ncbi:MAG: phosphoglycerate kinase [Dehalococcoidia bacterium]|nr:phosphoglycerate kinase [Dehalococcoidia bacterium]
MQKLTVRDIPVQGKRVLVRVDFNVPLQNGVIADDSRIRAALPTLTYLLKQHARIIVCSHLGQPNGAVDEKQRLAPVAQRLGKLLGLPVCYVRDCVGPEVEQAVACLKEGEVLLLENLRFHVEEEKNDPAFARALASLADVYVDDAFGAAHRAHASIVGVAQYLPCVAGLLMEREIDYLSRILESPERPFAAVLGGAKVGDKIGVLDRLVEKADAVLIGGGMAATFLKAQGHGIGKSLLEPDRISYVSGVLAKASQLGKALLLPTDVVITTEIKSGAPSRVVPVQQIPDGWLIADIGPDTTKRFTQELRGCRTVMWNGPMGIFEIRAFAQGTKALAETLASLKATTVVGGGSTAEAVEALGLTDKMSHVSTGGGASLEFLQGKALPGVAVLKDKALLSGARQASAGGRR